MLQPSGPDVCQASATREVWRARCSDVRLLRQRRKAGQHGRAGSGDAKHSTLEVAMITAVRVLVDEDVDVEHQLLALASCKTQTRTYTRRLR